MLLTGLYQWYTRGDELYVEEISLRMPPGSLELHPFTMSYICAHIADVYFVSIYLRTFSAVLISVSTRCRGLKVLVDLLDEDYAEQTELVVHALNGICSVFELQSPTTKNDFCRMFIREGLLDPLSSALLNIMTGSGRDASDMNKKIIQIILVFCQVSQSDIHVRNALGTRKVVRRKY